MWRRTGRIRTTGSVVSAVRQTAILAEYYPAEVGDAGSRAVGIRITRRLARSARGDTGVC